MHSQILQHHHHHRTSIPDPWDSVPSLQWHVFPTPVWAKDCSSIVMTSCGHVYHGICLALWHTEVLLHHPQVYMAMHGGDNENDRFVPLWDVSATCPVCRSRCSYFLVDRGYPVVDVAAADAGAAAPLHQEEAHASADPSSSNSRSVRQRRRHSRGN